MRHAKEIMVFASLMISASAHAKCVGFSEVRCSVRPLENQNVVCFKEGVGTYEGSLNCRRQFDGWGTLTLPSGFVVTGNWVDGKAYGRFTKDYPGIGRYVGQVKDMEEHGEGVMTYDTGERYSGSYRDGKRHGKGTLKSRTLQGGVEVDAIFAGTFEDGKKHGHFTVTTDSGVYSGNIVQNLFEGLWTYERNDGVIYEYNYEKGETVGHRVVKSSDAVKNEKNAEKARVERVKEEERLIQLNKEKCILEVADRYNEWDVGRAELFCEVIKGRSEFFLNCMNDKGGNRGAREIEAAKIVCDEVEKNPSLKDKILYEMGASNYIW